MPDGFPRRFLIDGTHLGATMKGVGRYVANVIRRLSQIDAQNQYAILVRHGVELPDLPIGDRFCYEAVRRVNHFVHGFITLPRSAKRLHADALWVPSETPVGWMPCPYVMMAHDVPSILHNT